MKKDLPFSFRSRSWSVWFFLLIGVFLVAGFQSVQAAIEPTDNVLAPPVITAAPRSASACEGSTVSLAVTATGTNVTYAWFRNGQVISSATSSSLVLANITTANAGDYTVQVTNSEGSANTNASPARITVNPRVTITATTTPVTCAGGANGIAVLAATGGTAPYQYQLGSSAFQASPTFTGLRDGVYPGVVRDAVGCTAQTNVQISQPESISLALQAVAAKCPGGSDGGIVSTATGGNGGFRYQINGGPYQEGGVFFDLRANTNYFVTATDRIGCTVSLNAFIGGPAPFDVKPGVKLASCVGSADGTVSLTVAGGTGPYQYQLGNGAFQTSNTFTNLGANTYEFTIRDAIGCISPKTTVRVEQPAPLVVRATSIPTNCFGTTSGSISVTTTGGASPFQYQLNTSQTFQGESIFRNVGAGSYTVTARDANGCLATTPVSVTSSPTLRARAATVPAACCNCPTGTVILASEGGAGTLRQYNLPGRPIQASSQFTGLGPGTYKFKIIDEAGCADSLDVTVANASPVTVAPSRTRDVTCPGRRDGEAVVLPTGGRGPYTFFWQTERRDTLANRTGSQTGLAEGVYTITVLDSNRCQSTPATVTIRSIFPQPPKPVVTLSGSSLTVNDTTGIQWYFRTDTTAARPLPAATLPTLIPFASGLYYVVVTRNGCPSPQSDPFQFVLTAAPEPVTELAIRVYPNPVTSERVQVEINQAQRSAVKLQMVDLSGRSVSQKNVPAFSGKQQVDWTLPNLPAGMYLIKAEAGQRQSVLRVMVQ